MDIGKSLAFVFEDEKWIEKVLIGGAVAFITILFSWTIIIPIIGAALMLGYMLELVRNVRSNEATPLPTWSGWGEKIGLGIKLFVVYLIWSLPLIIVSTPVSILSASADDAGGIIAFCFGCLAFLYGIVLFLAMPGITINVAESGRISSGLEFSNILAFTRENLGNVIIAMIVIWLVQIVASVIGLLLCGVGLFFTMFWATLVQGHLYGQIGRKGESFSIDTLDRDYSLSPDDVMPGVGELGDEVQSEGEETVAEISDLSESVDEVVDTTADVVSDEDATDDAEEDNEES